MKALWWAGCLVAGNLLVNGTLHLVMGLLGRKFIRCPRQVTQKQYEKVYAGWLSSDVVNAVYGLSQIWIAALGLATLGSFRLGATLDTGFVLLGSTLGTMLLAWKYEGSIG